MLRHTLAAAALLATSCASLATPVNLGSAGGYTLLATGTPWHDTSLYGDLILGSAAQIDGNVGARGLLNMGASAAVTGDADYGSLIEGPAASVDGTATQRGSGFWDGVYSDLQTASRQARDMAGVSKGYVNSNRTFHSRGNVSVFDITGLNLGAGNSLTLSGDSGDRFVINVGSWGFNLGGGAAIVLDGVSANNVLFNIYGNNNSFTAAAGTLQGTFIAPDTYMNLGDGLTLNGVRFLGAGIGANLQTVHGITGSDHATVSIPEPPTLLLAVLSLAGFAWLSLSRRKSSL